MSATTAFMSSAGFGVPRITPQSIRMKKSPPPPFGRETRKQSPSPWRYIRTRTAPAPELAFPRVFFATAPFVAWAFAARFTPAAACAFVADLVAPAAGRAGVLFLAVTSDLDAPPAFFFAM